MTKRSMRCSCAASRSRQRGQSTTEFLVIALVLVPIFIGVPLLGKLIDMMQATESASRYVAFEGTVRNSSSSWKTDAEMAQEVRRRFFGSPGAPVKTNDAAGDFTAHRNPLWSDHAGNPMLPKFETAVAVSTKVEGKNAILAAQPVRSALKLPDDNLYTGQVTIKPARIATYKPFDSFDLVATRTTVVLTDAWTARDNASIRKRIEDAPAIYPIAAAKPIVDFVGKLPTTIFDPALEVGNHDWDVVPCDRLVGGC